MIKNADLIHLVNFNIFVGGTEWRNNWGWGWVSSFWKYLGYDTLYTGRYLHQGLVNWWSWCQDQTMQDQDQRSKITANYLDRTKDRDHWQRSWRSRSKIDDLPHLWLYRKRNIITFYVRTVTFMYSYGRKPCKSFWKWLYIKKGDDNFTSYWPKARNLQAGTTVQSFP